MSAKIDAAPWPPDGAADPGDGLARCPWALADPLSLEYHDRRWGRPLRDDLGLFRMLILEGLQAGLSWSLILRKERTILEAFDGLDPVRVASYGPDKVDELMADPGVIRNRLKISSVVANARGFLAVSEEVGSFSGYLWGHAGHEPVVNDWGGMSEIPVRTDASERLSRDLKKRGFKFVGGGIVYSFMQAVGMVNDHLRGCAFRFPGENGRPGGPKS